MFVLHLSQIQYSPITIGGECIVQYGQGSSQNTEFLLKAIEINRQLVAAILREWESEAQCIAHVSGLIEESKTLEHTFSNYLKNMTL